MQQKDISIYEAFINGMSIGAIAKNHKLDKSQVKKVINRVASERKLNGTEVLLELPIDQAR